MGHSWLLRQLGLGLVVLKCSSLACLGRLVLQVGLKQLLLSVCVWCRAAGSVPRLCCGRMRGVNVQTKQRWPQCLPGASVCDYRRVREELDHTQSALRGGQMHVTKSRGWSRR